MARPSLCYAVNEDDCGVGVGDCSCEIDCYDLDVINSNMAPFYRCYYCYM